MLYHKHMYTNFPQFGHNLFLRETHSAKLQLLLTTHDFALNLDCNQSVL